MTKSSPNSARRSEYTTSYKDARGRTVHAATHLACNGLGCSECANLGFTTTYDGSPNEQPPRITDDQAQEILAAAEHS